MPDIFSAGIFMLCCTRIGMKTNDKRYHHSPKTPGSRLRNGVTQRQGSLCNGAILYLCHNAKKRKVAEFLF
jgi:hypothetical protein